jgi:hypothetical protein
MGRSSRTPYTEAEKRVIQLEAELEKLRKKIAEDSDTTPMEIEEMEAILNSDGGYWRIGLTRSGQYWARWKWTEGPYDGHYVIGGHNYLLGAVAKALHDFDRVSTGKFSPPYDNGFRRPTKRTED